MLTSLKPSKGSAREGMFGAPMVKAQDLPELIYIHRSLNFLEILKPVFLHLNI